MTEYTIAQLVKLTGHTCETDLFLVLGMMVQDETAQLTYKVGDTRYEHLELIPGDTNVEGIEPIYALPEGGVEAIKRALAGVVRLAFSVTSGKWFDLTAYQRELQRLQQSPLLSDALREAVQLELAGLPERIEQADRDMMNDAVKGFTSTTGIAPAELTLRAIAQGTHGRATQAAGAGRALDREIYEQTRLTNQ